MADPLMGTAALADLRALLPMVRHHVAMLSSPATAGQDSSAGEKLAELAGRMAALCSECDITDCAQLLDALHAALAQAPVATRWQPQFAAAALEAFGYALHRIGALGIEEASPPNASGQFAIASRLTQALETASHPRPDTRDIRGIDEAIWGDSVGPLNDVFADDEVLFAGPARGETAALTDDERRMLASFQSAPLRVTLPPAPGLNPSESLAPDSPAASLPRAALTGSGWAPGPADVLPDESVTTEVAGASADEQSAWRYPTAQELDEIPEGMKRIFLVETEEDLQALRLALLRYEQHLDDPAALHAMGRVTHKIKGTAATLGFDVLAAVTHSYEEVIKALLTQRVPAGEPANAALLRGLVLLQASLDASNAGQAPPEALMAEAASLLDGLPGASATPSSSHVPAHQPASTPSTSGQSFFLGDRDSAPPISHGDDNESSLRVDVHRLDGLMRHVSALAVNRAALLQTRDEVVRLQSDMDDALARLNDVSVQLTDGQPLIRRATDTTSDGANEVNGANGDTGADGATDGQMRAELLAGLGARDNPRHHEPRHAGLPASTNETSLPVWDELELDTITEVDFALRSLREVVADVAATSRELRKSLLHLSHLNEDQAGIASQMQRDVMHVRLVPLNEIIPRLEFEVKVMSGLAGKSVAFAVTGEMTEIDRNISDALREPLLQLVRNAVIHGVEPPEERTENGKTTTGAIWMHAYYVGSEVIIEIGDDGAGVNPYKLTASAIALHLLTGEEARSLSTVEALDLMFLPGVTGSPEAGTLAGRGVGLDEVRTAIERLKGSISVRSEPGKGSVFRVRVPISLSIVHALRVLAGDQSFAVPFTSVKRTLSLSASEILVSAPSAPQAERVGPDAREERAAPPVRRIRLERDDTPVVLGEEGSRTYEEIPVFALAALLGLEDEPRDPQPALLVEVGRQKVAVLVDGVREEQEVAVQALPRPLQRRAVRGASVTADGQLLLLLDLPELAAGVLDGTRVAPPPRPRQVPRMAETLAPRVLVVDDSVTIRQTLEHILRRGGFDVQLARDGIEALELMLSELPHVVILDIEMPRLDGFEMLSILRGSPQFNDVRVVMLTSRAAEKHKEHALNLGAQAYLIKPCPQETLLETVRGLLAEPASDEPAARIH